MKVREVMTPAPIHMHKDETVAVAARTLTHYNIGAVPVCGNGGRLCGLVTDRDMVTRCLAAGKDPKTTTIAEVMSTGIISVPPDAETAQAAKLMGERQIRRLAVVENGILCGMLSLGDLATNRQADEQAGQALQQISSNISAR